MKMRIRLKHFFTLLFCLAAFNVSGQIFAPVKWSYSSVREGEGSYTLLFTANIDPGWHVYSHVQPKKAVAVPLTIKFNPGEGTQLQGKALELGRLEKYHDESLGISAYQYSDKLVVRQTVKLKNPASKQLTGVLTYQTCNEVRCLPAEDVEFVVKLN
jgi:thiol:disulfide interchange protein DsbD